MYFNVNSRTSLINKEISKKHSYHTGIWL